MSIKNKILPLIQERDYSISDLVNELDSKYSTISMAVKSLQKEKKVILDRVKMENSGKARFQTFVKKPPLNNSNFQIRSSNEVQNNLKVKIKKEQPGKKKKLKTFEYYINEIKKRETIKSQKLTHKITRQSLRNRNYTLNILQDFFDEIQRINEHE